MPGKKIPLALLSAGFVQAALIISGVALLWEVVVRVGQPPRYLLPSIYEVYLVFANNTSTLMNNAAITLAETVLGFVIALIVGVAIGVLMDSSRFLAQALWPPLMFAQMTPKVALAPLLLAWFGFGLIPKIIVAFLITFFPILLNTYGGLRAIDSEKEELARSMKAGALSYLFRFKLPNALPYIFTGARVAITLALIGAVVGELVGSDKGMGQLVLTSATSLNTPLLFASVLILGFMGVFLYEIVLLVEAMSIPWHVSQRKDMRVALEGY